MQNDSRPFDAILFDLGGTLLYFDGEWPEVLARADGELFRELEKAGLKLDGSAFRETFRQQIDQYYRERESEFLEYTTQYVLRTVLGEHGIPYVPDSVLRPALNAMYAVTQQHWRLEEDAISTLEALREQGYRLGIISNAGDDEDVQALVDQAGLRGYFEDILTSAAQGVRKPNPRIFHTLLNGMGVPPARGAMVGDTLGADILGARNAGMFGVWITRRADNPANHAHAETIFPDATIATLAELPALLSKIRN